MQKLIQPLIGEETIALDLGCGGGRVIELLRETGIAETSVYGLDRNQTLLSMTRKRFPCVNLIRAELTEPPYIGVPEHSVDLVTAHLVLQYMGKIELSACLQEVRRLLKPRGHLAVGLPHPMRVSSQAEVDYFSRRTQIVRAPWGGMTTSSGMTISDYVNATIEAGFRVSRIEEPEVAEVGLQHEDAGSYLLGPSRLMMLLQADYSM